MAAPSSEVVIRPARHEDYEAVMEINREVFGGMDYLHFMYHHYIRHPHTMSYLTEVNGRVVSFGTVFVLDGGRRVLRMSGRALAGYEGRGYSRLLATEAEKAFLEKYPDVKIISGSSAEYDFYWRRQNDANFPSKIVRTWNSVYYHLNVEEIPKAIFTMDDSQVKDVMILNKDQVCHLAEDSDTMDRLFGDQPYIVAHYNWFPLSVSRASLEQIEREGIVTVSKDKQNDQYNVISFSNKIRTFTGMCLRFHLRHCGAPSQIVAQHLLFHMRRGYQVAPVSGSVMAMWDLPLNVDLAEVMNLVMPILGQPQFCSYGLIADIVLPTSKL